MTHPMEHCQRPWWKRPPVWFIAIAALVILTVVMAERMGKGTVISYGAFLDQVEAGNVASVTFQETEIDGRFKKPADLPSGRAVRSDSFRSRVPDFGDPTLIPELRNQHVAIDVASPSAWTWLLGRVPWPMLILLGAILVAAVLRLFRQGKAPSEAASPMPMHGMIGLVSGLFARQSPGESPPARDSDAHKT